MNFSFRSQKLVACALTVLSTLIFCAESNALIDLRLGYGTNSFTADSLNSYARETNTPEAKDFVGISADVVVTPPLFPIGVGLRYETMTKKGSTSASGALSAYDGKLDFTRTSILVNKRLLDTLIYLGPIVSIGLVNEAKFSQTSSSGTTTNSSAKSSFTGSVGVEGGVQLMPFRAGAELGYMMAKLGDLKDDSGNAITNTADNNVSVDLSGVYMKILLGVGF